MTPEPLTRDTATPAQVTAARQQAKDRLAAAAARCTPDVWEQLRAKYGITAEPAR
jgi:hypothetical protein